MSHGENRPNAGSKASASLYGEKASVIRIHNSIKPEVLVYLDSYKKKLFSNLDTSHISQALPNPPKLGRPIYSGKISAGQSRFPSPAQDYEQKFLDLNERYISNPPATFFFEVKGNSMEGAGIFEGDTVIVDRAVKPKSSSIVIAAVDGEWMVKRLYANAVYVFIKNSPFDKAEYYGASLVVPLPAPTDNSMQITRAALWALKHIYKKDIYYQKAGVMLMELVPAQGQQTDLFGFADGDAKASTLMTTIDSINQKYKKGTIKLASEGVYKSWAMNRGFKSPNYTGDWGELPKA